MKLVEIVLGKNTSEETKNIVVDFVKKLNKEFVIVKDSPGFIVNRVVALILNEATWLLHDQLASAEDVDKAIAIGLNLPQGPLRTSDNIGLDIVLAALENLHEALGDKFKPCPLLVEKVRKRDLGLKTSKGFYEYQI